MTHNHLICPVLQLCLTMLYTLYKREFKHKDVYSWVLIILVL